MHSRTVANSFMERTLGTALGALARGSAWAPDTIIQEIPSICRPCLQRRSHMQFKGQLLLPDEPSPGLRVNLDVAEHHLAVESETGGLGAWPLEVVEVRRLHGDVFAMTVAGEDLRFVADDTIAFAYSGLPAIERVSRPRARSTLRSLWDWIWNNSEEPASPAGSRRSESSSEEAPEGKAVIEETLSPHWSRAGESLEMVGETTGPPIDLDHEIDWREDEHPPRVVQPFVIESTERDEAGEDLADSAGCPAIRSDGRPCQSPILTASGYCYPHDPKRAFEDGYLAAQEARAQLKRDATGRLNRIYGRLEKAMRQVERGELDPEMAMAMAQLARTMCAILEMDEPTPGKPSTRMY